MSHFHSVPAEDKLDVAVSGFEAAAVRSRPTLGLARFVTVAMPDVHGGLRGKTLTWAEFTRALERGTMPLPEIILALDAEDVPVEGLTFGVATGSRDLLVRLEPETAVELPWHPGWGLCLASPLWPSLDPCEYGSRVVLERTLEQLAEFRLSPQVAFEYEVRFRHAATGEPITEGMSYSPPELARIGELVDAVERGCAGLGIELRAIHTEAAAGLLEINLAHRPALAAADDAALLRLALKEIALSQGLRASFLAKASPHEEGAGGHVHVSLWDAEGANVFAPDGESPLGISRSMRAAIGGLLAHMPAMCALYNPFLNSYKRLVPGLFAPLNATWGFDNRSASVRAVLTEDPGAVRLELRRPGADANPYLTLAAALGSSAHGIAAQMEPPDPSIGDVSGSARELLPLSLEQSLAAFRSDPAVPMILGERFASYYAATREAEVAAWRRTVTDWERQRGDRIV